MTESGSALDQLQQTIDYRFADPALLKLALRHKSAGKPNNERLEFLGDAILGAVVAETLFRSEGRIAEGEMTVARASLVNGRFYLFKINLLVSFSPIQRSCKSLIQTSP